MDGDGYPDRLRGDDIPLGARIVAGADAWDAMTSDRPYRAGMPRDQALQELNRGAGTQWDADVTRALIHLVDDGTVDRVNDQLFAFGR
jgi:HD-GYP domain-containing protein (c-di-GMP phosphodiesterase class II)